MAVEQVLVAMLMAALVAVTCIIAGSAIIMAICGWIKHATDWACNILDINGHKDQH